MGSDERRSDERQPEDDRRARALRTLILVAAIATPIFAFRYLPFQDLPQHLAAIRVLQSLHDPAFGLEADYVVPPGASSLKNSNTLKMRPLPRVVGMRATTWSVAPTIVTRSRLARPT